MKIGARALNRATLGRQLLLGRVPLGAADAVRRVVALQAQHPASPYLALWNRLADFDPAQLDAAFADRTVVKSNAVRMTLHAVHIDDYRAFREATEPSLRAAKLGGRFAAAGLTVQDAHALVPELLDFTRRPRTAAECAAWLTERRGSDEPGAWWGLRQYAPLWRVPTGEAWSFGTRPSYVTPASRPVLADPDVSAEALQAMLLRYLTGFGPASVADMAQFALVQRGRVRSAVRALADILEQLAGPDGETLYDIPGAPRPDEDTPAPPRLLGMWESILLAYADRGRVIPPEYRSHVTRANGDVLPTLLIDGYVAGVWRPVEGGIEATAFHPLPDETWAGLATEARSLAALLAGREPQVYRRYTHWWAKLPSAEDRVLSA
ncbi:winged helix DNA-binding domain-containing protein [Streptomyces litchfieldiae]|uniref:Winged helix DNA-binding domain-containing protein n=1 Tax=Streptomyces litchfieldiae TaxID=3075543 RepID=A0ABU2N0H2_9ACTN|nr:winged helix DNA-binding domain-containing protein [Streptomyces sp. DSM 44938]MDT0347405.1 winged helix DNA-binding domain-containing protein [Streptomyces sp. DSM 44938]